MEIKLEKTNAEHPQFIELVALLDRELAERDGDLHGFYDQYNKLHDIKYSVLAWVDNQLVGCGAIKAFDQNAMEVKRMYVKKEFRGNGYALKILDSLEKWAHSLGAMKCILETGKGQPEAIALYKKAGYTITENYGQYAGVDNSVCFQKILS